MKKSIANVCWFRENTYLCNRNRGNSSVGRAQPCQGWGREFESRFPLHAENNCIVNKAQVAELVDAHVSGACVERHAGSSPVLGTMKQWNIQQEFIETHHVFVKGEMAELVDALL